MPEGHNARLVADDSRQLSSGEEGARMLPANCPHKLTKTAEPWLGGEPPRAARTARGRHAGCSSLQLLRISRGSRRAAREAGMEGGFCSLE